MYEIVSFNRWILHVRKALIVGIDNYKAGRMSCLSGCVSDALAVRDILKRHENDDPNFNDPHVLVANKESDQFVMREDLRNATENLFSGRADVALFYFAGHGHADSSGGFLTTSESQHGHDGLSMGDLMNFANRSNATNRIIILDCCHSGAAADRQADPKLAEVSAGTTILTASRVDQFAEENRDGGLFTSLLLDALRGSAANLLGEITPASVYSHIDQLLGSRGQRPMFKTNIEWFVSLRKVLPPIPLADLLALLDYFPSPFEPRPLDPRYEPERSREQRKDKTIPEPDPELNEIFAALQRCVKVGLVRPVGAEHMWHAAMQSKACELTALGRHYHGLASRDKL